MKPLIAGLVLVLTGSAGYAAAAASAEITATLKTPLTQAAYVVRDQTAWSCDKDQCRTTTVGGDTNSWLACRALVRRVGPVSAYGSLDAAALAKCNRDATSK